MASEHGGSHRVPRNDRAGATRHYDIPYHPGALKYFAEKKIELKATR